MCEVQTVNAQMSATIGADKWAATRNDEVAGMYMKYFYGILECNLLIYRRKIPPLCKLGVDDWAYVDSFVIVIA